jgi:Flp pilus assembly protein TadG
MYPPHPSFTRVVRCELVQVTDGSSLIELALFLPIFLLLLVGTIDFGRGYYANIEVTSAAEAAAWYGVQQPADTSGIKAAATLDAADVNNLTTTVVTGCECSDGTSVQQGCTSPPTSCSATVVNYVQVTTNATYTPIINYPGIPSSFALQGSARMRSAY